MILHSVQWRLPKQFNYNVLTYTTTRCRYTINILKPKSFAQGLVIAEYGIQSKCLQTHTVQSQHLPTTEFRLIRAMAVLFWIRIRQHSVVFLLSNGGVQPYASHATFWRLTRALENHKGCIMPFWKLSNQTQISKALFTCLGELILIETSC